MRFAPTMRLAASLGLATSFACSSERQPSVAANPDSSSGEVRLYVADRYEGVFQLDPHTLAILDTIATGPRPHGLLASPDGRSLYITVETSNELLKVDVATHEIIGRVDVGPVPNEPTISANGRYVFVPQRGGDQTVVVETDSMRVVKSLPGGREQHNSYTSKNGQHVYVTSLADSLITVIDPEKLEIVRQIRPGGIPRTIAFTDPDTLAYLTLSGMIGFVTVDLRTDSVVDRLKMAIPEGTPPPLLDTYTHGVLLTPDQSELWIAVYASDKVYGFTMPGRKPLADLRVGEGPHWFTLHPDGEPLYVSVERAGEVAAIHRGLRTVQRKATVGKGPTRILAFRTPVD
jgi:DNA-binding beta-propeller fold protein YncE